MPSYGAAHRKLRAMLLATYYPGSVTYWRCGQPIAEWDTRRIRLGHDDDNPFAYRELEHARCSEAARSIQRQQDQGGHLRNAESPRTTAAHLVTARVSPGLTTGPKALPSACPCVQAEPNGEQLAWFPQGRWTARPDRPSRAEERQDNLTPGDHVTGLWWLRCRRVSLSLPSHSGRAGLM
jgi:hypothetical protein